MPANQGGHRVGGCLAFVLRFFVYCIQCTRCGGLEVFLQLFADLRFAVLVCTNCGESRKMGGGIEVSMLLFLRVSIRYYTHTCMPPPPTPPTTHRPIAVSALDIYLYAPAPPPGRPVGAEPEIYLYEGCR